jgi:alkaline phosphatase/alkaline phosphatase D
MRHFLSLLLTTLLVLSPSLPAAEIHLAQGLLAGEATSTSVILQTRLTSSPGPIDGDVPGTPGIGRFEVSTSPDFPTSTFSGWIPATAANDFILKTHIASLQPSTTYHYRAHFGPVREQTKSSSTATFHTLPAADQSAPIQFVLTSCLNYAFFQHGDKNRPPAPAEDRTLGYPALDPIRKLAPDFVLLNGDCVYYDHPWDTRAKTQAELRKKWHEQYVMPRFVKLFAQTATYWLKDDHDHRYNDSDTTGDKEPSHQLGIDTFREQVPVVDPQNPHATTYRTHRMGRDLQLWFVEGRDFRSPNDLPDGPGKSLWGTEQREWLQRTLKESDATFKILISPTPMVGPDDGYKKDNHANLKGFDHEGRAFFDWLQQNNIDPNKFLILCGDRHWKYHSIHPHGFSEFSCGALNRENSRLGRKPGDPKSNDPDAKIRQPYSDSPASGGFLRVELKPSTSNTPPTLAITLHDDTGKILYRHQAP